MDDHHIDEQLSRLPERIGPYNRRFAGLPDGTLIIEYSVGGFCSIPIGMDVNPLRDALFIEQGRDLDALVDSLLTRIELEQLLAKPHSSGTRAYIDREMLDQGLTQMGIIRASGTATMTAPCVSLPRSLSHIYFLVCSNDYLLVFGRKGNTYYLRRNQDQVELPIPPAELAAPEMVMAVVWQVEEIGLSGTVGTHRAKDWRRTRPTTPPNSLYDWARQQLLLSKPVYSRPGQVLNIIVAALQGLNEEVARLGDISPFWNDPHHGDQERKSSPKNEPIITRHIEARLRDITLMNNIHIHREVQVGNGILDLLFEAPLRNGENVSICVEIKKAHASDLIHGLNCQLPEYMRRVGSDHGIYCVLDFGENYPYNKAQFQSLGALYEPSNDGKDLQILLNLVLSQMGTIGSKIVTLVINVSQKPTPSQM